MRAFITAILIGFLPFAAYAQGTLIPRPCVMRPCPPDVRCMPCPPSQDNVVKTSSRVSAELSGRVLRYEVTETFVNRGGRVGEADYVFPLPRGAAFQDLKLSINGELVSGETMNAAQARAIYEEIVRRQRDPALVEWMGYGLLRARIFPIAPGEEKKVVVRFQMVAEREGDALRVDYFQGRQSAQRWLAFASDNTGDEPRSSFTLRYADNEMYGIPYSPTHSLSTKRRGDSREITTRGDGSEVTILLPVRKSSEPAISVLSYAPRNEDGFALITLSPPAMTVRPTPRDVTLVLDVSGSMAGAKIRQAKDAGKQVLSTLRATDRFRLIDFSTDVRTFRDEFLRATRDNIEQASRYLDDLDASGSTNISGALEAALDGSVPSGRLGLVLFLTDGAPTIGERNPDAIAAMADRMRNGRRVFSFGVGADLNVGLIERLALEGGGTAQFVRPDESVERAVSIVASRLTSPVVTNLRLRSDGARLVKRLPQNSVDLFAGQDYMLLARYEGSGSTRLEFEGETTDGHVRWTKDVSFPSSSSENSFVPRLWATQRVGYLAAEKRKSGGSREIDDEIRALGEKYGIPTEFTSYLVVEPQMRPLRGTALSNVVVTGVAAAPAPAAKAFEAARDAAKQRAATNLAAADEAAPATGGAVRRAGDRVFTMRGDMWTDTRKTDSTEIVKVKPFGSAYFSLMNAIPELRDAFALGEHVFIAGKHVAIEVTPIGVESLSDERVKRIQSQWQ